MNEDQVKVMKLILYKKILSKLWLQEVDQYIFKNDFKGYKVNYLNVTAKLVVC